MRLHVAEPHRNRRDANRRKPPPSLPTATYGARWSRKARARRTALPASLIQLPDVWKQRFLFMGVGGNAGTLRPSVNALDHAAALGKGYATAVTDTGHVGNGTSADWVRNADGSRDAAKVTDFLYRAAHDVTMAGKQLAQAFYDAPVQHAYFDGCSTGGRMAMMEAERYPTDYDGIIAGDPAMDYDILLLRFTLQKAALASTASYPVSGDARGRRQGGDGALRRA